MMQSNCLGHSLLRFKLVLWALLLFGMVVASSPAAFSQGGTGAINGPSLTPAARSFQRRSRRLPIRRTARSDPNCLERHWNLRFPAVILVVQHRSDRRTDHDL